MHYSKYFGCPICPFRVSIMTPTHTALLKIHKTKILSSFSKIKYYCQHKSMCVVSICSYGCGAVLKLPSRKRVLHLCIARRAILVQKLLRPVIVNDLQERLPFPSCHLCSLNIYIIDFVWYSHSAPTRYWM